MLYFTVDSIDYHITYYFMLLFEVLKIMFFSVNHGYYL